VIDICCLGCKRSRVQIPAARPKTPFTINIWLYANYGASFPVAPPQHLGHHVIGNARAQPGSERVPKFVRGKGRRPGFLQSSRHTLRICRSPSSSPRYAPIRCRDRLAPSSLGGVLLASVCSCQNQGEHQCDLPACIISRWRGPSFRPSYLFLLSWSR